MEQAEADAALAAAEVIRVKLEGYLDEALNWEIRLSEDDSIYDLDYIREKLAKISNVSELLSDRQMSATKIHLEVVRQASVAKTRAEMADANLRESDSYIGLSREGKTPWITKQMAVYRDNEASWALTLQFSREIRGQLTERIQMLRRLDSDLRLHQGLIEVGHKVGATGSPLPAVGAGFDVLEGAPGSAPAEGGEIILP